MNGGACSRTVGGTYICACAPGWAGQVCEKYSPSLLPSPPPMRTPGTVEVKGWVAGPVIGSIVAVCLGGCVYMIYRERRNTPIFGSNNGFTKDDLGDPAATRGTQLTRYSHSQNDNPVHSNDLAA